MICISRFLTILLLLAVTLGLVSGISAQEVITVTTTPSNSSLHSGPNITSETLHILPQGTALLATGRTEDSSWIQVEYEGTIAWIARRDLDTSANLESLPFIFITEEQPASTVSEDARSLPACSDDEMASIATTFQEFSTDFADLGDRIQSAAEADLPALTAELNDFQVRWWGEIVPTIPNCSPAADLSLLVGRMVDETLIAMALTQAGLDDLANAHTEEITALEQQFAELVSQFSSPESTTQADMTKPMAGLWTGNDIGGLLEVSFRITEQSTISMLNYKFMQNGQIACDITDTGQFPIDPDGLFSFNDGDFTVTAQFRSTTFMDGTYTLVRCGNYVFSTFRNISWTARWQES